MFPKRLARCAPEVRNTGGEKLVLEKVGIFVKISILVLGVEKH